jgi:hypothetical protein
MHSQMAMQEPTLQLPVPLPPALAESAGTLQMLFQGHRLSLARLQSALSTLATVLRSQTPTPVSSAAVDVSNGLGGPFYTGQGSIPGLSLYTAGGSGRMSMADAAGNLGGSMLHQPAFARGGAGTIPDTRNFQDLPQHDTNAEERMMSSDAQLRVVCPVCGGKGRNSERRCVMDSVPLFPFFHSRLDPRGEACLLCANFNMQAVTGQTHRIWKTGGLSCRNLFCL